jgi:stalled ribosome rescue protein Dom34
MKSKKQIGIWMDHSIAHVMVLTNGTIVSSTIESVPKPQKGQEEVYKDESHSLNKDKSLLSSFYNKLCDIILGCNEAVLFGPTDARNELYNLLRENHLFDKIEIAVEPADKMTEIERNTFVKEHFNTSK